MQIGDWRSFNNKSRLANHVIWKKPHVSGRASLFLRDSSLSSIPLRMRREQRQIQCPVLSGYCSPWANAIKDMPGQLESSSGSISELHTIVDLTKPLFTPFIFARVKFERRK